MKIIGSILVVLTAGMWGIYSMKKQKNEFAVISDLYNLVSTLNIRISSRRQELFSVYSELSKSNSVARLLYENGGDYSALSEILPKGVDALCESFGEQIGGGFATEQTKLCEDFLLSLSEAKKNTKDIIDKKLPLYRSLWLIAALCAAIIIM